MQFRGPPLIFAVARVLTDGTLDPTFGEGGVATADFPGELSLGQALALGTGRIVLAGIDDRSDEDTRTQIGVAAFENQLPDLIFADGFEN